MSFAKNYISKIDASKPFNQVQATVGLPLSGPDSSDVISNSVSNNASGISLFDRGAKYTTQEYSILPTSGIFLNEIVDNRIGANTFWAKMLERHSNSGAQRNKAEAELILIPADMAGKASGYNYNGDNHFFGSSFRIELVGGVASGVFAIEGTQGMLAPIEYAIYVKNNFFNETDPTINFSLEYGLTNFND